jgi:molybdopterin molybdotransferase
VAGLPGIDQALELVLARVRPLAAETVPIAAAAGRVLASDAHAACDLPPFDSSAMDGFAVRAADTPGRLVIVGHSAAGRPESKVLGGGEAITISTGAVIPAGADAVVPVERTVAGDGTVDVEAVTKGDNRREQGGDVRAGALVLRAGTRLGPVQVGALAAVGAAEVRCGARPRVVVLATGTELRSPGDELEPGEIYESNTLVLRAQLESVGAHVTVLQAVTDDEVATRAALGAGLQADVLVTSGGVSMGEHDLVRATLAELGAEEVFWRVAVRPGKPVAFATLGTTLAFGLPGNPVSALVGFELFVRPAILALQGAGEPGPFYLPGRLGSALHRSEERDAMVRARTRVDADGVVLEPLAGQESHMIVHAAAADALVRVPRGTGELPAGAPVMYLKL